MSKEHDAKSLIIFGRDVSNIPCFRNSFLCGIGGGLAFGLAHFMFTSKTVKSVNYSVYAFTIITMGYWMQCRYNYSKTRFEMLRLQQSMEERSIMEGTPQNGKIGPQPELIDI